MKYWNNIVFRINYFTCKGICIWLLVLCSCSGGGSYPVEEPEEPDLAYLPTVEEADNLIAGINNELIPLFEEGLDPAWSDYENAPVSVDHRTGAGRVGDIISWSWDYTEVCKGGCDKKWNFISELSTDIDVGCNYLAETGSNKTVAISNSDTTWITTVNLLGGNITTVTFTTETEHAAPAIKVNGYDF